MRKQTSVRGLDFVLEKRKCPNRKCTREYWCNPESLQDACSIACIEITTGEFWGKRVSRLKRERGKTLTHSQAAMAMKERIKALSKAKHNSELAERV